MERPKRFFFNGVPPAAGTTSAFTACAWRRINKGAAKVHKRRHAFVYSAFGLFFVFIDSLPHGPCTHTCTLSCKQSSTSAAALPSPNALLMFIREKRTETLDWPQNVFPSFPSPAVLCVVTPGGILPRLLFKLKFGVVYGAGGQVSAILVFTWGCAGVLANGNIFS